MTTIAYKDKVIAYDSRRTAGDTITDDDADKKIEVEGVQFFLSGATSDIQRFIDLYFGRATDFKNCDCSAMVVVDGKLYLVGIDEESGGLWKEPKRLDIPHAIGSGKDHALTAMDMGASPVEAVQMAAERNCKTGGRIRTFSL
jgi:ATP-dependent protease HslVU (ClpYQ) peptidase subunit